jgi:hypothetical protein
MPWNRGDASIYDPATFTVPAYLVDTPETRTELAKYYAEITYMDAQLDASWLTSRPVVKPITPWSVS